MTKLYAVQVLTQEDKWDHFWFGIDGQPLIYADKEQASKDLLEYLGNARDASEEDGIEFDIDVSKIQVREVGELARPGSFFKSGSDQYGVFFKAGSHKF